MRSDTEYNALEEKNMSGEYGDDYITITDDEGQNYELEVLNTFDFEGKTYGVFLPADMDPEDPDYGLIILEVIDDEEGGSFNSVDDEEELSRVYDYYMAELFEDDFQEEEED